MASFVELDGSKLTGGGQIIRTALALSAYTNKPFHIINIRHGRPRPGLMPQHLEAVRAMRILCNAEVTGMHAGSEEISFIPKGFTPQPLDIHIGTAGSVTLLAQAIMLPAMHHKKTTYTIHGGTDVRWSPPIDYFRYVIAPMLSHFGVCEVDIKRRGYYPKGGGRIELTLGQKRDVKPLTLIEQGRLEQVQVIANASQSLLDKQVLEDVERNIRVYLDDLHVPVQIRNSYVNAMDSGWGVVAFARYQLEEPRVLLGTDVLGDESGGPQDAARIISEQLRALMDADGVIDEHLADHLIPFIAIHGGEITVTHVSNHIKAAIAVSEAFLPATFSLDGNHISVTRS